MHMKAIKTVIVDNQMMFVECLKAYMDNVKAPMLNFVGELGSASGIMSFIEESDADLLLIELNLPDEDGLSLLPRIRAKFENLKICVLTSYGDIKFVKEAFQSGADGYVVKSNSTIELVQGITEVMKGHTFLAKGLRITPENQKNGVLKETANRNFYEDRFVIRQKLTRREQEILQLITQAKNNKEIAKELYISDQTVGVHRKNIMRKLGVRNTVNLIKFALEYQLV